MIYLTLPAGNKSKTTAKERKKFQTETISKRSAYGAVTTTSDVVDVRHRAPVASDWTLVGWFGAASQLTDVGKNVRVPDSDIKKI